MLRNAATLLLLLTLVVGAATYGATALNPADAASRNHASQGMGDPHAGTGAFSLQAITAQEARHARSLSFIDVDRSPIGKLFAGARDHALPRLMARVAIPDKTAPAPLRI